MNIHDLINTRITQKVLTEVATPTVVPDHIEEKNAPIIRQSVLTAGMAPFHYPRSKGIPEPWRAYHLWNTDTILLATHLKDHLSVETKEPMLLAACCACVLVSHTA